MTEHDPLDRQLPSEPRFVLMGRDARAEVLTNVYAYLRERKWDQAVAVLQAGIERLKAEPPAVHKDSEHARSARTIAEKMYLFRKENFRPEEPRNKVTTLGPEVGT